MIFVSSDLHLNHDREFVYRPRGFNSIYEMNEAIISRWNEKIQKEDDVYMLGDLALGGGSEDNIEEVAAMVRQLNGTIYWIRGNHDSDARVEKLCQRCENLICVGWSYMLHYKKYHFFMTHFPCLTGNLEKESLHQMTLNIYGHTHQKTNFYEDRPYMYHCGVDSHDCYPVALDDIIEEMKEKVMECKELC